MANEEKKDNRSASEKITDLENAVMALYQTVDNLARDTLTIKEAIKLLGNKADSIIKAATSGEAITDENITRRMVQNNVEDLAQKVKNMVAQGILVATDQTALDSFVVGSELDENNNTINPRLQFAMYSLGQRQEVQGRLVGSKPGDVLTLEEGKLKFKVDEVYQIQQPTAPEAADTGTSATAASAEAAPTPTAPASTDAAPAEAAATESAASAEPAPEPAPETASQAV